MRTSSSIEPTSATARLPSGTPQHNRLALRRGIPRAERPREGPAPLEQQDGGDDANPHRKIVAVMANKAVVGEKVGMTQVWDDANRVVPVTVLRVEPMRVVQVKTTEHDGYSALQVTFGDKDARKLNNPDRGHFEKAGVRAGTQGPRAPARRRLGLRGRSGDLRRHPGVRRARRRDRRQQGQGLRRRHEAAQLLRPAGLLTVRTASTGPPAPSAPAPPPPECSRAPGWRAAWAPRRSPR